MAGGRPQLKRSFSIIPCFVFVEVRNPGTLCLRLRAPLTRSQTLSGEEVRSGATLPGFESRSVHPSRRTLGTSHTLLSSLSFLVCQIGT